MFTLPYDLHWAKENKLLPKKETAPNKPVEVNSCCKVFKSLYGFWYRHDYFSAFEIMQYLRYCENRLCTSSNMSISECIMFKCTTERNHMVLFLNSSLSNIGGMQNVRPNGTRDFFTLIQNKSSRAMT